VGEPAKERHPSSGEFKTKLTLQLPQVEIARPASPHPPQATELTRSRHCPTQCRLFFIQKCKPIFLVKLRAKMIDFTTGESVKIWLDRKQFQKGRKILEMQLRSWKIAMARGALCRCPACGKGQMFRAFLKPVELCAECAEPLHHQRADDAPPYFTMMIVGHIVIPIAVIIERVWHPEIWLQLAIWLPLTLFLTLGLLPVVKGAIMGCNGLCACMDLPVPLDFRGAMRSIALQRHSFDI
jgi:uncharacterized protein (DUF983 family)